jgi:hypothetical protein
MSGKGPGGGGSDGGRGEGVRCNSLVGREKSNGKEVRRLMINQNGSEEKGSGGK